MHPLISAEVLAQHLDDPLWVIVDCRFRLSDPPAGRRMYLDSHIAGAHYADLDADLAGPITDRSGRHPLPDPEALNAYLGRIGLEKQSTLVAYDDAGGAISARLWWLARWVGHERSGVLDGGLQAWTAASGATAAGEQAAVKSGRYPGVPGQMPVMDTDTLAASLGDETLTLLDAREPDRFSGQIEPLDTVAGHVPGALNAPFSENLTNDQRFHPGERLRRRYQGLTGSSPTTCMCGSGVTACHNILAIELAGLPDATLYPGSWSEWIRDTDRPIARHKN